MTCHDPVGCGNPMCQHHTPAGRPMQTWNIGEVVQLKSGGPKMTIAKVIPEVITVAWFENQDSLVMTALPTAMFTKTEEPNDLC